MIYPDLTILLSLLVTGEHTREARDLLRSAEVVPLTLSVVHRLQVENALLRFLHGADPAMRAIARDGLLLWRQYVEEGVFELRSFALEAAFAQATAWNAEADSQPPRWHLLVHVAVAATEKATFMCLDPLLRKRASKAGLALFPAKLAG
jgi:hypothetical protein